MLAAILTQCALHPDILLLGMWLTCVFTVLIQLLVRQHVSKLIVLLFQTPSARLKNATARGFELNAGGQRVFEAALEQLTRQATVRCSRAETRDWTR